MANVRDAVIAVAIPGILRQRLGPRRSRSLQSLVWCARGGALIVMLGLVAGIISDSVGGHFWERHGLIAGVASGAIVVMVSVAIVNVTIERWRRERWKVLAQYVMLELIVNARQVWTGIAELSGNMQSGPRTAAVLDDGSQIVRDTSSLTQALAALLADSERRGQLQTQLASLVASCDEIFGRWAGVMLNARAYAEIIDRHVELARYISWLDSVLGASNTGEGGENQNATSRRNHHPAVQFEDSVGDDLLAGRLVTITQQAEQLDRATLYVALRIIPTRWWENRFGAASVVWTDQPETYSYLAEQSIVSA